MTPSAQRALASLLHDLAVLDELPDAIDLCKAYVLDGHGENTSDTSERTSSSAVADPTAARTGRDDRFRAEINAAYLELNRAQRAIRNLALFVDRMRPIALMADEPLTPCGNLRCDRIPTGKGNDRLKRHEDEGPGLCPRCYKHAQRYDGGHWPYKPDGRTIPAGVDVG